MTQLHTPAEAAEILKIRESWLRGKYYICLFTMSSHLVVL